MYIVENKCFNDFFPLFLFVLRLVRMQQNERDHRKYSRTVWKFCNEQACSQSRDWRFSASLGLKIRLLETPRTSQHYAAQGVPFISRGAWSFPTADVQNWSPVSVNKKKHGNLIREIGRFNFADEWSNYTPGKQIYLHIHKFSLVSFFLCHFLFLKR